MGLIQAEFDNLNVLGKIVKRDEWDREKRSSIFSFTLTRLPVMITIKS